jgi:hypothetical protein
MRVTIIRADGYVAVDGVGILGLDLSFMSPDISAVQWYDTAGEIEWNIDRLRFNSDIVALTEFQPALDAWQVAKDLADNPPPPDPNFVPPEVSPYQARIALLQAGLLASVEALMADPNTPQAARLAWEYATIVQRQSPFISTLGSTLGLTETQIDDLFCAAAQIT